MSYSKYDIWVRGDAGKGVQAGYYRSNSRAEIPRISSGSRMVKNRVRSMLVLYGQDGQQANAEIHPGWSLTEDDPVIKRHGEYACRAIANRNITACLLMAMPP
jgi:hypothetical protein